MSPAEPPAAPPAGPPPVPAGLQHASFYRFVALPDPPAAAEALRALAQGLQGDVVVAHEGVSGTLAGDAARLAAFEAALQRPAVLGGALRGMVFKRSACDVPPFGRLKVGVRREIVALGLPGEDRLPPPDGADASHLSPAAWRALLEEGRAVVLDNRNHFEFRLGRFRGAVDPGVHNFRDFVAYVEQHAPAWREAGRPVAMYCTGGIRCDKTAPWLRSLGLEVRQLDGGILRYLQEMPDAQRDWQGDCFVFDRRMALDAALRPTGIAPAQVYDSTHPDEAWRLRRALQLDRERDRDRGGGGEAAEAAEAAGKAGRGPA